MISINLRGMCVIKTRNSNCKKAQNRYYYSNLAIIFYSNTSEFYLILPETEMKNIHR